MLYRMRASAISRAARAAPEGAAIPEKSLTAHRREVANFRHRANCDPRPDRSCGENCEMSLAVSRLLLVFRVGS